MTPNRLRLTVLVLLGTTQLACGEQLPVDLDTRVLVETLASDAFEGRRTGSVGSQQAADYIIDQLEAIGAKPLPGQTDFRQSFAFTVGVSDGGTALAVSPDDGVRQQWAGEDIRALSVSVTSKRRQGRCI